MLKETFQQVLSNLKSSIVRSNLNMIQSLIGKIHIKMYIKESIKCDLIFLKFTGSVTRDPDIP